MAGLIIAAAVALVLAALWWMRQPAAAAAEEPFAPCAACEDGPGYRNCFGEETGTCTDDDPSEYGVTSCGFGSTAPREGFNPTAVLAGGDVAFRGLADDSNRPRPRRWKGNGGPRPYLTGVLRGTGANRWAPNTINVPTKAKGDYSLSPSTHAGGDFMRGFTPYRMGSTNQLNSNKPVD